MVRYSADDKSQVAIANLLGPLSSLIQADGQDMKQAHEMVLDGEILQDELSVRGVTAPARVRDAQGTGVIVYGAAELTRLSLTVEPADGPAFQAEAIAAIVSASAHKVHPGADLTVKYDPEQPLKVIVAKLSD